MILREMLAKNIPLLPSKELFFEIIKNEVPDPYSIKWKVLNRGIVARQRDMIRGQIFQCKKYHKERTLFNGEHVVECYIIKDNTVVARDRIDVPIVTRTI